MKHTATDEMREACHLLAEYLMRFKPQRHSQEWLRDELIQVILGSGNIDDLARDYAAEYKYADVQNPFLAEALQTYDEENLQ